MLHDHQTLSARGIELFVEASDLVDSNPSLAADRFDEVLEIHARVGEDVILSTDDAELAYEVTLGNLAIACQGFDFARMRAATTRLIARPPRTATALTLHAIALKHTDAVVEAGEVIAQALALDPMFGSAHHELACLLAEVGDVDAAITAVDHAMEFGIDPEALAEDPELEALQDDPRFITLTGAANHARVLGLQLAQLDREVGALVPGGAVDPEAVVDDETYDVLDHAVEVVRRLLEVSGMDEAPTRDRGDGITVVDGGRCDPARRAALEAIVACPHLWAAVPFLHVLGEFHVPNGTPDTARAELGL
jgi:tetratricopeptide (TPR) repeat protein